MKTEPIKNFLTVCGVMVGMVFAGVCFFIVLVPACIFEVFSWLYKKLTQ